MPEDYDVYKYDNDFPALSPNPPAPDDVATDFFETAPCYGKCEVILYSPQHTVTLPELPTSHIVKLVNLWVERYEALAADPQIKYVFIFENRGDVVGVTMPHPHGQIYGLPLPAQEAGAGGGKRPGVPAGEGPLPVLRHAGRGGGRRAAGDFPHRTFHGVPPLLQRIPLRRCTS